MKTKDILVLGAVAIGGFLLYQVYKTLKAPGEAISSAFAPITDAISQFGQAQQAIPIVFDAALKAQVQEAVGQAIMTTAQAPQTLITSVITSGLKSPKSKVSVKPLPAMSSRYAYALTKYGGRTGAAFLTALGKKGATITVKPKEFQYIMRKVNR